MRAVILSLSLLALALRAWHPTGHFVVARIAEIELMKSNAALYGKLVELLKLLGPYTKEKDHPFVECACFPDDIKYIGWKAFNQFHFYDHYILGPGKTPADLEKLPKSRVNMASSIADARETLRNTKSSQVDDRLGKSFELRYLIHLVGDVHQPLHSSSRVSDKHSKGDAGGNAFKLSKPKIDLHTYWDKIMGFYTEVRAPLEGRHWDIVDKLANDLMTQFKRSDLEKELQDPSVSNWIKAGKGLAQEYAYKGIEEGGEVTEAYRNRAKPILDKQLVLAGYRLYDMIVDTYKNGNLNDFFVSHKKNGVVSDDESEADANNSALVEVSDEESPGGAKKGGKDTTKDDKVPATADKAKDDKKKPAAGKKGKKKEEDSGKILTDKKKRAPKNKKFDEDDYDPEDEDEFEEQRSAEMPESEVKEDEPKPGFFSRMFSSIGNFFRKLFGG